MKNGFNKSQHLCGEITISQLFREGKAFLVFPLRVVYRLEKRAEGDKRPAVRVLTSVPKKQFKHAVDRNRFKRLIRESYRLQQHELNEALDSNNMVMNVAFTAVHNQLPEFDFLKGRMAKILSKLVDTQRSAGNGQ